MINCGACRSTSFNLLLSILYTFVAWFFCSPPPLRQAIGINAFLELLTFLNGLDPFHRFLYNEIKSSYEIVFNREVIVTVFNSYIIMVYLYLHNGCATHEDGCDWCPFIPRYCGIWQRNNSIWDTMYYSSWSWNQLFLFHSCKYSHTHTQAPGQYLCIICLLDIERGLPLRNASDHIKFFYL